MNSDLIQELTTCLDIALKNFEQDTIPRPSEIKRLREALAAGKASVEPLLITRPKVSAMEAHSEWTKDLKRRKKQEQAENRAMYEASYKKQKAISDQYPVAEVTVTLAEPNSPAR